MLCGRDIIFVCGLPVYIQTSVVTNFKTSVKHVGKTRIISNIMCILADCCLCKSYGELNNHLAAAILDDRHKNDQEYCF